jgi:hypothetical protein
MVRACGNNGDEEECVYDIGGKARWETFIRQAKIWVGCINGS